LIVPGEDVVGGGGGSGDPAVGGGGGDPAVGGGEGGEGAMKYHSILTLNSFSKT
jgi:hypothetical protein